LLFYMCHSMMGLTRCYKTAVVYILYLIVSHINNGWWWSVPPFSALVLSVGMASQNPIVANPRN